MRSPAPAPPAAPPAPSRVTLKEIARLSGFGVATVSRALQGLPGVQPATRHTIECIAQSLGYQPDPNLAALSRYRRHSKLAPSQPNLAFFFDSADGTNVGPDNRLPFTFRLASERAGARGFHLEPVDLASWRDKPSALERMLHAQGIRGIIVRALEPLPSLDWSRFHTVLVVPQQNDSPFDCVCPDYARGLREGVHHALSLGYRRLGIVLFDHLSPRTNDAFRSGALLEWSRLHESGATGVPFLEFSTATPESLHSGYVNLIAWMTSERPDVVLASNCLIYFWLQHGERFDRTGVTFNIPGDVGFIALRRWDAPAEPAPCPYVDIFDELGGPIAVDLLDQAISTGLPTLPERPFTHLFPAPLIRHPRYVAPMTPP